MEMRGYTYFSPVAFVEVLNGKLPADPSTGVRIVREYLTRELADRQDNIVFNFLGPSPFHGNFFRESLPPDVTQTDSGLFTFEKLQLQGYADLTFRHSISDSPAPHEVLELLFDEIEDELGLFYEIHRIDSAKHDLWSEIDKRLRAVMKEDKNGGWLNRLQQASSRGRDVAKLHNLVLEFEASQVFDQHLVRLHHREIYERDTPGFLKSFLDSALQDRPVFPVQQVAALVTLVDDRRSKALELLVVIVAAIIGAVSGALITLAIS